MQSALARLAWGLIAVAALSGWSRAAAPKVVHYLPFPAGKSYSMDRGIGDAPTHADKFNYYAYDFSMAVGTPICASAPGTVIKVKEDTLGPTGAGKDNNGIDLIHADGSVSSYDHLEQNGALVEIGQRVLRGDVIGRSGNTGNSTAPHLHWMVRPSKNAGESIKIAFADLPDDGVPKKGQSCRSKNPAVRFSLEYQLLSGTRAAYDLCRDGGCLAAVDKAVDQLARLKPRNEPAAFAEVLAERDTLVSAHSALAAARLKQCADLTAAKNLVAAVRLASFGPEDFAKTKSVKGWKAALAALKTDPKWTESVAPVKGERAYRVKFKAALRAELKIRAKLAPKAAGAPVPKAKWKSTVRLWEKALAIAPPRFAPVIKAHIATLAKPK